MSNGRMSNEMDILPLNTVLGGGKADLSCPSLNHPPIPHLSEIDIQANLGVCDPVPERTADLGLHGLLE